MAAPVPGPGELIARRYRVDCVLGQGAMGVVLGARDERTGVPCAIKILGASELPGDRERMLREARALMLLSSPHVVRIFDVGELDDGSPYLVLERLRGKTLAEMAPLGEPLPAERVARWLVPICGALAQAHGAGIIHRDIKLSNVFLSEGPDGSEVVKLLDFGISKLAPTPDWTAHTLTSTGGPLGSPQFVSPEQLQAPHAVDARTDVWSLGVVVFRLVTGRFPFDGDTAAATFRAILASTEPPRLPSEPGIPAGLQGVIDRCLTRDLRVRYASTAELAADLERFARPDAPADDEAREAPDGAPPTAGDARPLRASRPAIVIAASVAALAVVALVLPAAAPDTPPPEMERPAPSAAAPIATASAPSEGPPSPPLASSDPEPSWIEIVVTANAPIHGVRAPGLRRLTIDDRTAVVAVSPWSGSLPIEVDLGGGRRGRGEVHAGGKREVHVTEDATGRPAPRRATPARATPAAPPAPSSSSPLRRNPYL